MVTSKMEEIMHGILLQLLEFEEFEAENECYADWGIDLLEELREELPAVMVAEAVAKLQRRLEEEN